MPGRSSRAAVYAMAFRHAFFGVVPVLFTAWIAWYALSRNSFAVDFHHAFWPAGVDVLHGVTPYVAASSPDVANGTAFVYPAPAALLMVPFGLLPHGLADVTFTLLSLAAALVTLRLLAVRDWRLYGLVAMWPAVISSWQSANLSLLLALGIAAAWRYRDRPAVAGPLVALLVSVKLFVWPLGLWLLATRRYRALGYVAVCGLVVNLIAWSVLGFGEVHHYTRLASAVTRAEERSAYTVIALLLNHGTGRVLAYAVGLSLAALGGLACLVLGRRGRDSSALLMCLVVCLLATPIVWRHYFALLIVPLAIMRPRLSPLWLLPLGLSFCPVTGPTTWQLLITLAVIAAIVGALLAHPQTRRRMCGGLRRRALMAARFVPGPPATASAAGRPSVAESTPLA